MQVHRSTSIVTVLLLLLAAIPSVSNAQKKGKPGGGGSNPPVTGEIYFNASSGFWEYAADGSHSTELGYQLAGAPSQSLHNGRRWLLRSDGGELFALRDDGLPVQLTNEPSLSVKFRYQWVGSATTKDVEVAFVADELDLDPLSPTFGTVIGTGVYIAEVLFNGSGIPSLATAPGLIVGDVEDFDFSPDGSYLAFPAGPVLFVLDLIDDELSLLPTDGSNPQQPSFSPDGMRIAYRSVQDSGDRINTGVHVVQLGYDPLTGDVTNLFEQQIVSAKIRLKGNVGGSAVLPGVFWSPDGQYLACGEESWSGYTVTHSILRVRDDGSNPTELWSDGGAGHFVEVWGWR